MDRFEGTVSNALYGHTHEDQFYVYYEDAGGNGTAGDRVVGAALVAPSVNTWTDRNPAFRVLTLDGDYQGSSRVQQLVKNIIFFP